MDCSFYDVGCHFSWLQAEAKLFFVWAFEGFLSGLSSLYAAIPAPDFMTKIQGLHLSDSVLYFTTLFQLPFGLGIVVAAYTSRFILRRIPGIG